MILGTIRVGVLNLHCMKAIATFQSSARKESQWCPAGILLVNQPARVSLLFVYSRLPGINVLETCHSVCIINRPCDGAIWCWVLLLILMLNTFNWRPSSATVEVCCSAAFRMIPPHAGTINTSYLVYTNLILWVFFCVVSQIQPSQPHFGSERRSCNRNKI